MSAPGPCLAISPKSDSADGLEQSRLELVFLVIFVYLQTKLDALFH